MPDTFVGVHCVSHAFKRKDYKSGHATSPFDHYPPGNQTFERASRGGGRRNKATFATNSNKILLSISGPCGEWVSGTTAIRALQLSQIADSDHKRLLWLGAPWSTVLVHDGSDRDLLL